MPGPAGAGDLMIKVRRPPFTVAWVGYPMAVMRFLAASLPAVLVTATLGCAWPFNHYFLGVR